MNKAENCNTEKAKQCNFSQGFTLLCLPEQQFETLYETPKVVVACNSHVGVQNNITKNLIKKRKNKIKNILLLIIRSPGKHCLPK